MRKSKIQTKSTMIRLPKPLHDRLTRLAADRSIKTGRRVGVGNLIIEAVEKSMAPVA